MEQKSLVIVLSSYSSNLLAVCLTLAPIMLVADEVETPVSRAKIECETIGFKPGTESFKNCLITVTKTLIKQSQGNNESPVTQIDPIELLRSDQQMRVEQSERRETQRGRELDQTIDALKILQGQQSGSSITSSSGPEVPLRRLERQETLDNRRICYYRLNGQLKPLVLQLNEFCPLTL